MKILLISPPFSEKEQKSKGLPIAPPVLEREDAIVQLRADLFSIPQILERVCQVSWKGFPMSHITSWMVQFPQGRAFHQFARERDEMKKQSSGSREAVKKQSGCSR